MPTQTLKYLSAALLAFVFGLAACNAAFGKANTMTPPIDDWSRFEFSCVHEDLNTPTPSPEAEAIFQRSRQLYRQALAQEDVELLREYARLTLQAAEMGHVKAMSNLVLVYIKAEGFPRNSAKAVEWAEKLMAMNKGVGYYHMGTMLQRGIGVKKNLKAALAYIRRSADLGNSYGQYETGIKMFEAFGSSPDKATGQAIGAAMLQCALDQNFAQAGYKLGIHYGEIRKDGTKALQAFQQAAKLGHEGSLYILYSTFKDGKYGIVKDPQRATCYHSLFKKASRSHPIPIPDLDHICPLPPKPMPRQR